MTSGSPTWVGSNTGLRVQSYACVVWVSLDWRVLAASENGPSILNFDMCAFLGKPLSAAFSDRTCHDLRSNAQVLTSGGKFVHLQACRLDTGGQVDITMTRAQDMISIEFEKMQPTHGHCVQSEQAQRLAARLSRKTDPQDLVQEGCRILSVLTGFNQVSVIKGNPTQAPEVLAEYSTDQNVATVSADTASIHDGCNFGQLNLITDISSARISLNALPELSSELSRLLRLSMTNMVVPDALTKEMRSSGARSALRVPVPISTNNWGFFLCHHRDERHPSVVQRSTYQLFGLLFGYEMARVMC